MTDDKKSHGVLNTKDFSSQGDWINQILEKHCTKIEGATEAIPEVKDKDGKVTQKAVAAKAGKPVTDEKALRELAAENNLTPRDEYPNIGMTRMNIGNMLRSCARRRWGLTINGKWKKAPDDFKVNEVKSERPDGTKIAKKKDDKKDAA